ncbi:hypothetical protein FGIG_04350, partial [Fasciola gigantica]
SYTLFFLFRSLPVLVKLIQLSFKRGETILVSRQMDGGWWEGSLNGVVGWFPSNYVVPLPSTSITVDDRRSVDDQYLHLRTFQDEIVQHILEGEVRQVSELAQLISGVLVHLEPFIHLPFLNKVGHMKELLNQAIHLHQTLASALDQMKRSSEPKRVGKLFLDFASTINAIGCDYSKIHLYVVTGIDKNADIVERHMSTCGVKFQPSRWKQQLSLVFDRLGRYPLLLKEMERYLENPHVDRTDIQRAMSVYGEITERCAILRKFKEYDIDILLSTINGWQGMSIDKLGDPILTLRVLLTAVEYESPGTANSTTDANLVGGQLSVLVIFPTCVLLLARNKQMDVYEFTKKVPLSCLTVMGSFETEADVDLLVTDISSEPDSIQPCRISLTCTDQNARDLLVSTLTDLIHYQTQMEQTRPDRSLQERNPSTTVGVAHVPTSTTTATESITTTEISLNREQTEYSGIPSEPECTGSIEQLSHLSGHSQRSSPGRDVGHPACKSGSDQGSSRISDPADRKDLSSTSEVAGSMVSLVTAGASSKRIDESDTPATLSSTPLNGIRIIPHLIQTNAHVRWLGIDSACRGKEDIPPPSSRVLRCLRLDGPLNVNPGVCPSASSVSYVNWAAAGGNQYALSNEHDSSGPLPVVHAAHTRPHSPKGDSGREIRRKKSDRQKSAINVDEVLRSVGGMQLNERRNADAARILQVVEAYCASAWNQLSCRSLDPSKDRGKNPRVCSGVISPTESKTLLQQVVSPSFISDHPSSANWKQPTNSTSSDVPGTSKTGSNKSSGLSASAIVRSVAKRSGSTKHKSETTTPSSDGARVLAASQLTTSLGPTPGTHSSSGPGSESSVVQSFSPPPVILPTRGGRRL